MECACEAERGEDGGCVHFFTHKITYPRSLEGGCQAPIAAHASLTSSPSSSFSSSSSSSSLTLHFIGRVLSLDGSELIEVKRTVILGEGVGAGEGEGGEEREREEWERMGREGERVGREAAEEAIGMGAGKLIAHSRGQ